MERISFLRDPEGKPKRIYLSSHLPSPEPILAIQDSVSAKEPFIPVSSDSQHLTILHYGKPHELFKDFSKANPSLVFEEFMNHLYRNLEDASGLGIQNFRLPINGLDIFEDVLSPVLVVRFGMTHEFEDFRDDVLLEFNKFIQNCGISDPALFMSLNPNLRYQLKHTYSPHVSIGSFVDLDQVGNVVEIEKSEVDFSAPKFGNVIFSSS